jgi:TonB family protein
VLAVTIGKDGVPRDIHVTKSPSTSLSKSAIDTVRTWHDRPYLPSGESVEVQTTINVTYILHD